MEPSVIRMPSSVTRLRVRYAETDRMGVAYYANYLVWFEVARTDLLRTLGWTYREMEDTGVFLPVIDAQCEYLRSTRYDDELDIETTGEILSPVRMAFSYTVRLAGTDAAAAIGRTIHAATTAQGKPRRLPEKVRGFFT
jgi:acyl-CoA thioester hydrolase